VEEVVRQSVGKNVTVWSDDFKLKLLNSNGFSECDLGLDHLVFAQMPCRGDVRTDHCPIVILADLHQDA
jgi:hypothetical protein